MMKPIYEWPLTTKILIFGLLSTVFLYLGYLFDLHDLQDQITSIKQQEEDLKEQYQRVVNKEMLLQYEVNRYKQTEKILQEWQKKLITHAALPELLNMILKIGASNQIQFLLFNPEQEKKEKIYTKIPIKVTAVGEYHLLATFLTQIVNLPWIVALDSVTLSAVTKTDTATGKTETTGNRLTAEITLLIYQLTEKK